MDRSVFLLIWAGLAVLIFAVMLKGWATRVKRSRAFTPAPLTLSGEIVAKFSRVNYVSTTREGAPLERIAIGGLAFKGLAELVVRRDGVQIAVTGEPPVAVAAADLCGTATARGRIGKVVERDGLLLLRWRVPQQPAAVLESSFRFDDLSEQLSFAAAVAEIAPAAAAELPSHPEPSHPEPTHPEPSQEPA